MPSKFRQKKTKESLTELRSRIMRAIKGNDTKPERTVASWLKQARFRPLRNYKAVLGSPDFVLPRRKVAIFVQGCFWHGHSCPRGARQPKNNADYWIAKIARNRTRDKAVRRKLVRLGWQVIVIWECALERPSAKSRLLVRVRASRNN